MSYKISRSASSINKEASAIQQNNTLAIFGATIITFIIAGAITWMVEMITGTTGGAVDPNVTASGVAGVLSLLISLFVVAPLGLGIEWAVLRLVDEDRFHIGNIFEPFQRRYFRNVWNQIIFNIVVSLWMMLFMAIIIAVGVLLFNIFGNPDAFAGLRSATSLELGDFTGLAGMVTALAAAGILALIILMTWISLRLAMNNYLLFDNDRIGGRKPLTVSKEMVKGNKGKLFLIGLQNAIVPILIYVIAAIAIVVVMSFVNSTALAVILGVFFLIIQIVVSIIYSVRQMIATALFYRLLTDEHGRELDSKFPELDLTPDVPVNEYHTEDRPAFTENATAIHPADDIATGTAANQAVTHTDAETETVETTNEPTTTAGAVGGAAAVFSAADEDQVTDEVPAANESASSSAIRGAYTVGQAVNIRQPYQATFENNGDPVSAIKDHFVVEASDLNRPGQISSSPRIDLNAGPATESDAVRHSYVVGSEKNHDDQTSSSRQPYNIMGYNTPERTDFSKVENAKEVILAADKAESGDNGALNPGDFDADVSYDPEIDPDSSSQNRSSH